MNKTTKESLNRLINHPSTSAEEREAARLALERLGAAARRLIPAEDRPTFAKIFRRALEPYR